MAYNDNYTSHKEVVFYDDPDTASRVDTPNDETYEYEQRIAHALEKHTGSPDTYLTLDQEQDLAGLVLDGLAAQAELDDLQPGKEEGYAEREAELTARIREGTTAEQTLVECNLKLAAWLARVSMGLHPESALRLYGPHSSRLERQAPPKAELDDRIQAATIGLIKAAHNYRPGVISKRGDYVGFVSYAIPTIIRDLNRHGHKEENLIYIPDQVIKNIFRAQYSNWQEYFSDAERNRLIGLTALHNPVSLDHLFAEDASPEEVPYADHTYVPAAEVIPDQNAGLPLEVPLRDYLETAMEATLSEREADTLRRRFGMTDDGDPQTLQQIGESFNVTKEAIRQIESRALRKLARYCYPRQLLEIIRAEEHGSLPMRSGDIVTMKSHIGHTALRLSAPPDHPDRY
jgi:RNA polymerase sigma factor (sigma-70 family)